MERARQITTVYEDPDVLAVDKPPGLVSTSGNGSSSPGALEILLGRHRKLILMHRLDRDTSGLLLLAKRSPAAGALSQAFEKRLVRKTYLAVVSGEWPPDLKLIESKIERGEGARMVESLNGKTAITAFRVLLRGDGKTLVEARPKTGRTHQIRVHCAQAGFPILGDKLYGGAGDGWPAQALHAFRLDLRHPTTGENLNLHADPASLERYGLYCRADTGKNKFYWGEPNADRNLLRK